MVNKAGKTVVANAESLASAMNDFADKFDGKLTNTIVDGAGRKELADLRLHLPHPAHLQHDDCVKAQKLAEYVKWTLTDAAAAKRASELGYAVLPKLSEPLFSANWLK